MHFIRSTVIDLYFLFMWAIAEETQLKELVREHPEIQSHLVSILLYNYIKWCKFNLI